MLIIIHEAVGEGGGTAAFRGMCENRTSAVQIPCKQNTIVDIVWWRPISEREHEHIGPRALRILRFALTCLSGLLLGFRDVGWIIRVFKCLFFALVFLEDRHRDHLT
jgi:hypothetical protein